VVKNKGWMEFWRSTGLEIEKNDPDIFQIVFFRLLSGADCGLGTDYD
jgi:hypothetical protein